jgi:hypothetical protein
MIAVLVVGAFDHATRHDEAETTTSVAPAFTRPSIAPAAATYRTICPCGVGGGCR